MWCDDLKAYLDGELGILARLRMRMHVSRCASCRQDMAEWPRLSREIEQLEGELVPPGLRDTLMADAMTAAASARSHTFPQPAERPRAQGVWAMRKTLAATALAVLMLAVGLWLCPRQTESTALADMAVAMKMVGAVHFVGFTTDRTGVRRNLEGWVQGNRLRIRVDGTKDILDDGERLIEVDRGYLPKVTIRVSGAWPGLAQGMTYLDLFNEPGALKSAMIGNGARVLSTTKIALSDGRQGFMTELGSDGTVMMRIVTDARTNLLVGSETLSENGTTLESIRRVEYDVPIPDRVFAMNIPRNLPVVDLVGPPVGPVTGSYKSELERLNADPNARMLLTDDSGSHPGSSCGTWFHPDFQFEVLGNDSVAVYYLADRNVYRILGRMRALNQKERWYSQPVDNGDIRLPGEPRIEAVLMENGKPGDYCGTEPRSLYRFQNVGPGNATITYHRIKGAYVIRGTVKVLPIGKICTNDIVKLDAQMGRDIAEYINSGGKLDCGNLPPSETESMKADLDVALRLFRIQSNKNRQGHTVIDGAPVAGLLGTGSQARGIRFEAAGPGTRIWVLDVPSRREFHVIGRVRLSPSGKIMKNGVVDYKGNVLSSEE